MINFNSVEEEIIMDTFFKSKEDVIKVADFLPYPFIITEIETFDSSFESLFFNENLIQEFGYTTKEIPDVDTWYELLYPDENYRNEIRETWNGKLLEAISKNEQVIKIKARLKPKDKDEKWYEIKTFFFDNFFVLAFVDINNEVILQQKLSQINLNNERMLSILGHDLRNPIANLTAISSLAAENDISNEEFKEMVKIIHQESNLLLEMIETILNWTKLNFNTVTVTPVTIDYNKLVNGIIDFYSSMIQNKHIAVNVDLDNFHSKECDPEIMTVIIRNLLSNAIKFTPEYGSISFYNQNNVLIVEDSGVGMSAEKINSINADEYVSTYGTENEKGIGIGLQLVKRFAAMVDCKIDFESIPEKGTKVKILF
ncbi:sensor histidine kinase KdpD [Flavobacterium sp. H122]|uniref:sensor histidine kinase n=1 Tax=Flavobacterium sp. H122 TaxID=2529860 RepID=UPI0010A9D6A1|nr:PAS domain-containing sensor histidine kinase [Flavobacterium sp. H122]